MPDNTILFISHKQSDSPDEFDKFYNHLRKHYDDDEIYIDIDSNEPGKPWKESQQAALEACACMLVVVGKDWTPGKWIAHELATTYERGIPVIPVGIGEHPNFMGAEELEKLVKSSLELLEAPYTHDPAIVEEVKHLFAKQAEMVTDVNDITQLEELDRLIWSQALMPPCKGKLPAGYHLPFVRNQVFTGREADLLKLAKLAMEKHPNTMLVTQLVEGMGGIGKTQLAVEFCYRYGRFFKGVHWLNLRDPNAFEEQVAENGRKMFGPAAANMELPQLVDITLATWEKEGPRLIVFDNLEDEAVFVEIVKRLNNIDARIILTARNKDWGAGNIHPDHRLPVDCFAREESLTFLKEVLGEKYSEIQLNELAERMGDLPLALELASAYLIKQKFGRIEDYYAKLDEQSLEHRSLNLIGEQIGYTGHDLNLGKTFLLSYETLTEENAQFLFKAASFIAPNQSFPAIIFQNLFDGDYVEEILNDALNAVENASLIYVDDGYLSIHPLLAEFGQRLDSSEKALIKMSNVTGTLSEGFLGSNMPNEFDFMLSHFINVAKKAVELDIENAGALLNNIGAYFLSIAAYSRALEMLEIALDYTVEHYGENTEYCAPILNSFGEVFRAMGQYEEAKTYSRNAVKIARDSVGENNIYVAAGYNNLGNLQFEEGDYEGAKNYFERALAIDESLHGADHHYVAMDISNLGSVHHAMGDFLRAKKYFYRAIKIDEIALGSHHPNLARDLTNLGGVLLSMGEYEEAKEHLVRAKNINEAIFGPNHPTIAKDINNIGGVLKEMGDMEGAQALYEKALEIDEALLGPDHPAVARDISNLGGVMDDIGNTSFAMELFERAKRIYEEVFGSKHPDVAQSYNNIGSVYHHMGHYEEARINYERALILDEELFGPHHPRIATRCNNLGILFLAQRDYLKSIPFLKRAIKILSHTHPAEHPWLRSAKQSLQDAQTLENLRQTGLEFLGMKDKKTGTK